MKNLNLKQRTVISARKELIEQNRIRISFERSFTRRLINLFVKIGDDGSAIFESTGTEGVDVYFTQAQKQLEELFRKHYFEVIKTFSERLEVMITKRENDFYTRLTSIFINTVGLKHINDISATTLKLLRKVIADSQKAGLSVVETAKKIKERFSPRFSRARANTIARTETHSAASFANHQMGVELQKSGLTMKKQWVATSDERTRDIHRQANGTRVDIDESFIVGGMKMKYTGDPSGGAKNVINCRCVTLYVEEETRIIDDT